MSAPTEQVIAIDVGGTHLRAARIDRQGRIVAGPLRLRADLARLTGDAQAVTRAILDRLSAVIRHLSDQNEPVGIGFPGYISEGIVRGAPNIPSLCDLPLAALLEKETGRSVCLANDANCAALGEWRFGAGAGADELLHLTLGTGVGGGWIRNGAIEDGSSGMAMEIGHLRVDWRADAPRCGCGARGCLEQFASAGAVARRYGAGVEAEEVCRRAHAGDAQARRIFTEAGAALGGAIAQVVKLLDLRLVTISGGMIGAWPLFQPAMAQGLEANLIPPQRGRVIIRRSTLDDAMGLLGAAALVL